MRIVLADPPWSVEPRGYVRHSRPHEFQDVFDFVEAHPDRWVLVDGLPPAPARELPMGVRIDNAVRHRFRGHVRTSLRAPYRAVYVKLSSTWGKS